MILIIDLSFKKDSLSFYEFVQPLVDIVKEIECFEV
jgi:hypothetical protein